MPWRVEGSPWHRRLYLVDVSDLGVLTAQDVSHAYQADERVLDGVDLEVRTGELVAITGTSGSGKSTLLHILSGLIRPSQGTVRFRDQAVHAMSERARAELRLRHFGFVFQFGDLIPELNIVENVALPSRLLGRSRRKSENSAMAALEALSISDLASRRLSEVSGGQLQRAALARALVHQPKVLFADEPTGSLDEEATETVIATLATVAHDWNTGVVVVTHDPLVSARCDRTLMLRERRVAEDQSSRTIGG